MESKWLQVVTIMKKEAQLLLSFLVFGKKQKPYLVTYEASRVFLCPSCPFHLHYTFLGTVALKVSVADRDIL